MSKHTYLGKNFVGNVNKCLANILGRTGGFEGNAVRCLPTLKAGLGTLVDVVNDLRNRLFQVSDRLEIRVEKCNVLLVLSRKCHAGEGRAAWSGQGCRGGSSRGRSRGTRSGAAAIDAICSHRCRLLAPSRRNGSLGAGLDRTKGWKSLLRGGIERSVGGLFSRPVCLLLPCSFLAQRGGRVVSGVGLEGGGGGRRMGHVFFVDNILNRGMVVVLLHQLLGGRQTLTRAAGSNCLGCHCM